MIDLTMKDTIAAPATATGQAGIGIIRLSGRQAEQILQNLFIPRKASYPLDDRKLYLGDLTAHGEMIDECMAVIMRAPHSYTREDVVEFQLHGSPMAMKQTLDACIRLGARPAEAGEFTLRAFLNGRIDLSQAESVMQLIRASSDRAARKALSQLNGGTSTFVSKIQERLTALLAHLEAAIDYPEEVEEQLTEEELAAGCREIADTLSACVNERALRLQESGLTVALCGSPNAGKSTLLNALLQEEKAIVTPVPGTTRDIVSGDIYLDGCLVHISDTAGLHESSDQVESIGMTRAIEAARQADLVFWLMDGNDPEAAPPPPDFPPCKLLYTKGDLTQIASPPQEALLISAGTGEGLEEVKQIIRDRIREIGETPLSSRRHMNLCREAAEALRQAADAFSSGIPLEFGAVYLHSAMDLLFSITGIRADEALLSEIFSQFCVGK